MELQRLKEMYVSQKRILEILETADKFDERYNLLLSSLSVYDVEKMREFVKYAEDIGIPLTIKKVSN
jgi:hypothetical protein